ncbi:MAG TPA: sigma-70 family RNA polymerase sigma factor [Kiritimatiellia bacterium]|nr:sigma-70 family RNA polymerase sigma factor [Kiritimatiellia bacterium]
MNNPDDPASNLQETPDVDWLEIDEWACAAQRGDEEAFGRIVRALHQRVFSVVYRVVGNMDDATEIAQLAWIKAWQKLHAYKREARFFTWMYRIAVNTAMDHHRRTRRRREVDLLDEVQLDPEPGRDSPVATHSGPDEEMARRETMEQFQHALGSLSPEHRAVLVLREVEGLSYKEISEVTGTRQGTVMSRLHYARKTMQDLLKGIR